MDENNEIPIKPDHSDQNGEKNVIPRYVKNTALAFLIATFLEIGAISSMSDPQALIWVANIGFFIYLGWTWDAKHFGHRNQAIGYGLITGLIYGFVVGAFKFLLWQKFFYLFYLITDPTLKAIYGGAIVGLTVTALQSPKIKLFFQRLTQK